MEPIYDNSTDRLIGVAGTDVNLARIRKNLEEIEEDSYGYSFLVDNNGQTVFHTIRNDDSMYDISLYETFGGSQEGVPENEDNYKEFMDNVRHSLIARIQGNYRIMKTIDYLPVCTVDGVTDYYYRPIAKTPFSVAVAFPRYTMGHVSFKSPGEGEWETNTFISDIFSVSELDEFKAPRGIEIVNVSDDNDKSHLASYTHASIHVNNILLLR